jgi:hypothetical protein
MRQISWQLSNSLTGLRSVTAVAAFLVFFFPHSCAEATEADSVIVVRPDGGLSGQRATQLVLVKPDQYNVEVCEDYFNKLKPGLASETSYKTQERYTINRLCEARSADLSRLVEELDEGAAAVGAPQVDARSVNTLRAEFVKAVVESNEFDAPGYDRIAISGFVIDGNLNLAKITINNTLQLENIQFLGNVDFRYSSTAHNLDISGTLPEAKALCLKGFQTTASVFIYNMLFQPDKQPVQDSTSFCTDTVGSISIGLQGARIGGQLSIRNTAAKTIDAQNAEITGQVLIQNSTISEVVDFSAATAGGFYFLEVKSPSELKEDSQCDHSAVYLEGTNVLGSAEFVRSDLCGIVMTGAHVSKNVDLLGLRLALFDFSGSNAEGDLQIGPSRGPPMRVPVWLPPFGNPLVNLVLSHSSVALVRVALNNWPKMCDIGMKPKDRKDKCARPRILKSISVQQYTRRRAICRIATITLLVSAKMNRLRSLQIFDLRRLGNRFTARGTGMRYLSMDIGSQTIFSTMLRSTRIKWNYGSRQLSTLQRNINSYPICW